MLLQFLLVPAWSYLFNWFVEDCNLKYSGGKEFSVPFYVAMILQLASWLLILMSFVSFLQSRLHLDDCMAQMKYFLMHPVVDCAATWPKM